MPTPLARAPNLLLQLRHPSRFAAAHPRGDAVVDVRLLHSGAHRLDPVSELRCDPLHPCSVPNFARSVLTFRTAAASPSTTATGTERGHLMTEQRERILRQLGELTLALEATEYNIRTYVR